MNLSGIQGEKDWGGTAVRVLAWVSVIGLAASAAVCAPLFRPPRAPAASAPAPAAVRPDWPVTPPAGAREWAAFRSSQTHWLGPAATSNAPLSRYRLAGTFLISADPGGEEYRKAIIDDLEKKKQHLLAESESVDDLRVVRIHADRVVVDIAGRTEVLGLGFLGGAGEAPAPVSAVAAAAAGMTALETSRFGKRVQENRWLLERDPLMQYYRELLDDPERIAKLYETFRPEYADGKVAGYTIDIQGEKEFLDAVGLRQGDTVRMVNSMKMTSQSRAEFFLGEFVKERLNAVVLDVEREGKPQKIVYLIR